MRTFYTLAFTACIFLHTNAQEAFKQAFKAEFPIKVETRFSNEDASIIYGRNDKGMAAMSAADGKIIWQINYEKDFGIKELDYYRNLPASKVIVYYTKGSKKSPSEKLFLDALSGKILWRTTEFGEATEFEKGLKDAYDRDGNFLGNKGDGLKFYDVRTGKESADVFESAATEKNMLYFGSIASGDMYIEMSYEKKIRSATSGNNQTEIEVVASKKDNSAVVWRTKFEGNVVALMCTYSLGLDNDVSLDWQIVDDQLFIYYDGIAALDLKTGKLQWQKTFDRSNFDFGLKATQTLDIAALPIVTADAVYYADLSKESRELKKLNRKTGELIWKSEELSKSDIVPNMYLENGKLICQFGGEQVAIKTYDGNCWAELEQSGNFGLRAYDAQTGKIVWNSTDKKSALTEDFNKMISNVLLENKTVYAHGSEYLLGVDPENGKEKFATNIKELKVGKPMGIAWIDDGKTILLRAKGGVVTIDALSGKVLTTTKLDDFFGEFEYGDKYFVWTGKAADDTREFVCIDLKTGKITGIQKDTPYPDFAPDGSYFLRYEDAKVVRYNVE